jgi:hypothetical protein
MRDHNIKPSPTRTYVAICNRSNFDGHYFRKFHLPRHGESQGYEVDGVWSEGSYTPFYPNTNATASWYFLNVLNHISCIDGVCSWEDYTDVKTQEVVNETWRQEHLPFWN